MKNKRIQLGYTQEKVAELSNLSYSSYTKIENAIQGPSLNALIRIAAVLKMSMDMLIFGEEEETKESTKDEDLLTILENVDTDKLKYTSDFLAQLAAKVKEYREEK